MGPTSIAGLSGPARSEEERPDHEKCDAGSTGTGEVIAESGGNAVFSSCCPSLSSDPFRSASSVALRSDCALGALPSSSLDPVCVRPAPARARCIDVEERENDCSNGLGSSSNLDLLTPATGGRIGGRWRTAGRAAAASAGAGAGTFAFSGVGVGGRTGMSTSARAGSPRSGLCDRLGDILAGHGVIGERRCVDGCLLFGDQISRVLDQ